MTEYEKGYGYITYNGSSLKPTECRVESRLNEGWNMFIGEFIESTIECNVGDDIEVKYVRGDNTYSPFTGEIVTKRDRSVGKETIWELTAWGEGRRTRNYGVRVTRAKRLQSSIVTLIMDPLVDAGELSTDIDISPDNSVTFEMTSRQYVYDALRNFCSENTINFYTNDEEGTIHFFKGAENVYPTSFETFLTRDKVEDSSKIHNRTNLSAEHIYREDEDYYTEATSYWGAKYQELGGGWVGHGGSPTAFTFNTLSTPTIEGNYSVMVRAQSGTGKQKMWIELDLEDTIGISEIISLNFDMIPLYNKTWYFAGDATPRFKIRMSKVTNPSGYQDADLGQIAMVRNEIGSEESDLKSKQFKHYSVTNTEFTETPYSDEGKSIRYIWFCFNDLSGANHKSEGFVIDKFYINKLYSSQIDLVDSQTTFGVRELIYKDSYRGSMIVDDLNTEGTRILTPLSTPEESVREIVMEGTYPVYLGSRYTFTFEDYTKPYLVEEVIQEYDGEDWKTRLVLSSSEVKPSKKEKIRNLTDLKSDVRELKSFVGSLKKSHDGLEEIVIRDVRGYTGIHEDFSDYAGEIRIGQMNIKVQPGGSLGFNTIDEIEYMKVIGDIENIDTINTIGYMEVNTIGAIGEITSITKMNANVIGTINTIEYAGIMNVGTITSIEEISALGILHADSIYVGEMSSVGILNVDYLGTIGTIDYVGIMTVGTIDSIEEISSVGILNVDNLGTIGTIEYVGIMDIGTINTIGEISTLGILNVDTIATVQNIGSIGLMNVDVIDNIGTINTVGFLYAQDASIDQISYVGNIVADSMNITEITEVDRLYVLDEATFNVINNINQVFMLDATIQTGTISTVNISAGVLDIAYIKSSTIDSCTINAGTINVLTLKENLIGDQVIVADNITNLAVTEGKIGNLAVTTGKIDNLAVDNSKLGYLAVHEANINNLSISAGKLKTASVTSSKIKDFAVTSSEIGTMAVTTEKINNLAVVEGKIGSLAVTTGKIDNLAVTEAKLGNLAVATGKIDNLAVTEGKIANLAITSGKVDNLAITEGKIGGLAVTTDKVDNFAITNAKIGSFEISYNRLIKPPIGWNEVINPSFEYGSWPTYGTAGMALVKSTFGYCYHGQYYMKAYDLGYRVQNVGNWINVVTYDTVTASGYYKTTDPITGTVRFWVRWYNTINSSEIGTDMVGQSTIAVPTWTRVSKTIEVPTNAQFCRVGIDAHLDQGTAWFDALQLTEGNQLTSFVDLTTAKDRWIPDFLFTKEEDTITCVQYYNTIFPYTIQSNYKAKALVFTGVKLSSYVTIDPGSSEYCPDFRIWLRHNGSALCDKEIYNKYYNTSASATIFPDWTGELVICEETTLNIGDNTFDLRVYVAGTGLHRMFERSYRIIAGSYYE